jgi:hypothetical protein
MPLFCQPCAYGYHHDNGGTVFQLRAFHEVAQMQETLARAAASEKRDLEAND